MFAPLSPQTQRRTPAVTLSSRLVHSFVLSLPHRRVLSAIFPIMATTWLGFLVFFLPRDDMNGRLGECGLFL